LSADKRIRLADAYGLRTPGDSKRLYAEWAPTFESDFVKENGYVLHEHVAAHLAAHLGPARGTIVDVGCGTGIVGAALAQRGFAAIHGMDISHEMLAEARGKLTARGEPVYQELIQADLTQRTEIGGNAYAGIASAGTFTHGHLGPEVFEELWRIAAPGSVCAISINAQHFEERGFSARLADDEASGVLTVLDLAEVNIYENAPEDFAAAGDKALIFVGRIGDAPGP